MSDKLRLVIFDCDSTLSAIEGVDELARVRGPELFAEVEAMTHAAMDGKIPPYTKTPKSCASLHCGWEPILSSFLLISRL